MAGESDRRASTGASMTHRAKTGRRRGPSAHGPISAWRTWLDHQDDEGYWLWPWVAPALRSTSILCLTGTLTLVLELLAIVTRVSPSEWLPVFGYWLLQPVAARRRERRAD